MVSFRQRAIESPLRIAGIYTLFGVIWILVSDQLIFYYVDDPVQVTRLQTFKGWVFVLVSALLVYGLVYRSHRDLRETNAKLDNAIQQTSILDRILRHNLRNSCNVIKAHAEMIEDGASADQSEHLAKIRAHNDRLIDLSDNSRQLRDIVLSDGLSRTELDLTAEIRAQVERLREEYPEAEITTALPETLRLEADTRIGLAIAELLENAIHHNDAADPSVFVTAEAVSADEVRVQIEDDGPGMPELERQVLRDGIETQLTHSQGLGLWIVRTLVVRQGGEFAIPETTDAGTVVELTLPRRGAGGD